NVCSHKRIYYWIIDRNYSWIFKIHKDQLHIINQKIDELINLVEPKKKPKSSKQIGQRNYPPEIENLWNDLVLLYEKRIKSDSKFSFNKMVLEIHKLLGEGKRIAVSTIRNFYLRRTIPRKTSIMAIRCWIEDEKKKTVNDEDGEEENQDIDDSDFIINNSNGKNSNNI